MNDEMEKAQKVARDKYLRSMKKMIDELFRTVKIQVVLFDKNLDAEIADLQYKVYEVDDPDLTAHFKACKAELDELKSLKDKKQA